MEFDVLSWDFLKREKLIDGIIVRFRKFDLFGMIGVIRVGTTVIVAFQNKSGNTFVFFAIDGWASG